MTFIFGGIFIFFQVKKNITLNIENELSNSTAAVLNMVKTAANVSIKNYLRAVCEKNIEIIQAGYKRYESGEISEAQAKEDLRRVLFSQTIGKTGYVYCVSSLGIPVEHPNPDVVGKKKWADRFFVKEMIRMKHGYMEYDWKNPGETDYRPKAVYIQYFEPWDWILAVSTYTEELSDLINVGDFRQGVLDMKFGKTGYSFIVDGECNPIVHPRLEGWLAEDIHGMDKDDVIPDIVRLKKGKLIYSWRNSPDEEYRKKLIIFNHIPEYNWIVASSGYFNEFYEILGTVKKVILFTILAMLGFSLLTSLWLSRLIIEPLQRLMDRLGMGIPENLSTRMPMTSTDEIGKLVTYFNGFMEKLEDYSNSLKTEISKHYLTSEALRESELRYRTILKCIYEGYFETDLYGNILFINPSMELITGYSREDLLNKNIMKILCPKDGRMVFNIFNGKGIKEQNHSIYEWQLIKKDKTPCFVEISLTLMADKYKHQTGIRGVLRDVTRRVQAQDALRLSEEMFSKAFQCSPSGMFVAHIENGRLIKVNDSFLSSTGYDAETVIGEELMNLDFFKNKNEGKNFLKLINEKRGIRNKEIEFCTTQGEVRDGIISAEVIMIWGETCILAAMEDLTDVRRLERRFLDMTERQRHEIAFTLHDDLCPQLIGIEMLLEILKSKLNPDCSEPLQSLAKIEMLIRDSIRKIRLLSRGICPVDIVTQGFSASLSELVGYVEDMFGIVCHLNCDNSNPFADNTAAAHAYYIAHEAVHNAVKHAKSSHITIHFSTRKDKTILMVRDDGKGIQDFTGRTGLGLKIMKYRAKCLNASLNIRRNEKGGTIVLLEIGPFNNSEI
ncbi:MAG: cache domain-containing protein [Desulfatirhabdiaceae bacterium]